MRGLKSRLARLERAAEPKAEFYTLEDLVRASYGHPLPAGKVWGGPLAALFAALGVTTAGAA